MTYLEDAAEHLREAGRCRSEADQIARQPRRGPQSSSDLRRRGELNSRAAEHERAAAAYTRLAAIEAGLPPCNCHEAAGPETP
jgi:hypothetical protein